jgi:hypothetical protein
MTIGKHHAQIGRPELGNHIDLLRTRMKRKSRDFLYVAIEVVMQLHLQLLPFGITPIQRHQPITPKPHKNLTPRIQAIYLSQPHHQTVGA